MAFSLLYPRVDWTYQLQATKFNVDISGAPAIAIGENDDVYFAFSARGQIETGLLEPVPFLNTFQIIVGCVDSAGVLKWIFRDPQLISNSEDSNPVLALGNNGELYLTFVTIGAVPGKINGINAPNFCGGCGSSQGPEDIVVARINGVTEETRSVAWVVQDASVNSCSVETRPRMIYDTFSNRLLLTYTSSGAIICATKIGSKNIIVTCLEPNSGGLVWVYQSSFMNTAGINDESSITVDSAGGIYIAYTISNQVDGGAPVPTSSRNVEVIKITASGSPLTINRNWILSGVNNVNPTVKSINSSPTIVFDSAKNRLFLSWITTGVVPGGIQLREYPSIVFASIDGTTGVLNWLKQSPIYNEQSYRYISISLPVFTLDVNGVPYVSARAIQDSDEKKDMIFTYRLEPDTGNSGWIYYTESIAVRAYLPAIDSTFTPNTAFRVGANYSGPIIAIRSGNLYVVFINRDTNTFQLVGLRQVQRYQDVTAFDYMNNYTDICG